MAGPQHAARKLGVAWIALCSAFAVHVADEALTGFLSVYNPTVLALRARYAWFPMPVFEFTDWLSGLVIAVAVLLALSPFAFRGAGWLRPVAYVFAVVMLVNGVGHTLGTILGHTLPAITFPRPMPGFYSSPLLLIASVNMLVQFRRTADQPAPGAG